MPDVFANITNVPPAMLDVVANVLETRAAIPSQQQMIASYLGEIEFPKSARVLEVGCGTGPICRTLAAIPNIGEVIGVDPSEHLLAKARDLSLKSAHIKYQQGDGRALGFEAASFDAVTSSSNARRRLLMSAFPPRLPVAIERPLSGKRTTGVEKSEWVKPPSTASRARAHPPPIDVGIRTAGRSQVLAEDQVRQARCHPIIVAGCTTISAPRQSNILAKTPN